MCFQFEKSDFVVRMETLLPRKGRGSFSIDDDLLSEFGDIPMRQVETKSVWGKPDMSRDLGKKSVWGKPDKSKDPLMEDDLTVEGPQEVTFAISLASVKMISK